jgi:hypothetical protein
MIRYSGTGTFSFHGFPSISGNFSLIFENDSKATLWLVTNNVAAMQITKVGLIAGSFIGTSLKPKCNIEIDTLYFNKANFNSTANFQGTFEFTLYHTVKITYRKLNSSESVRLRRSLANFIFYGTQRIRKKNSVLLYTKTWINVSGRRVCLVQAPDFKKRVENLKKNQSVLETCRLWIRGKFGNLKSIEEICQNIETLCSLASGNYVVPLYEDVFKKGRLCISYLFPLKTYPFSKSQSSIDLSLHGSQDLKIFLEKTYSNYVTIRDFLGLPYVAEFFISSKMSLPLEAKYILMSTAFECLKRYYRDWRGFPKINDLVIKIRRILNDVLPVIHTYTEIKSYRDNRNS